MISRPPGGRVVECPGSVTRCPAAARFSRRTRTRRDGVRATYTPTPTARRGLLRAILTWDEPEPGPVLTLWLIGDPRPRTVALSAAQARAALRRWWGLARSGAGALSIGG